jgi:hypothetical protein
VTEIICGSKKYDNICLDKLVDSFDIITRHNMLLPNMGYGKREADFQICNKHVAQHYENKTGAKELFEDYVGKKISIDHMEKVCEFFNTSKTDFIYYGERNNFLCLFRAIQKHKIDHTFKANKSLMKIGLSHVAQCIEDKIKPFLIGYSLKMEDLTNHKYTNHKNLYDGHDQEGEVELLKKLHNAGLVDATLCLIKDESTVSLSDEIEPTEEGLRIINDNLR